MFDFNCCAPVVFTLHIMQHPAYNDLTSTHAHDELPKSNARELSKKNTGPSKQCLRKIQGFQFHVGSLPLIILSSPSCGPTVIALLAKATFTSSIHPKSTPHRIPLASIISTLSAVRSSFILSMYWNTSTHATCQVLSSVGHVITCPRFILTLVDYSLYSPTPLHSSSSSRQVILDSVYLLLKLLKHFTSKSFTFLLSAHLIPQFSALIQLSLYNYCFMQILLLVHTQSSVIQHTVQCTPHLKLLIRSLFHNPCTSSIRCHWWPISNISFPYHSSNRSPFRLLFISLTLSPVWFSLSSKTFFLVHSS